MVITRRVFSILAVVVAFLLLAVPAPGYAQPSGDGRLVEIGLEGRVVQLVADKDGTCALTEQGQVYCWGASRPETYDRGRGLVALVTLGALLIAGGIALLRFTRS